LKLLAANNGHREQQLNSPLSLSQIFSDVPKFRRRTMRKQKSCAYEKNLPAIPNELIMMTLDSRVLSEPTARSERFGWGVWLLSVNNYHRKRQRKLKFRSYM
jgi:hypothetical protein